MKRILDFLILNLALCFLATIANGQVYTTLTTSQEVLQRFDITETSEIPSIVFNALTPKELKSLYLEDSIAETQNEPYRFAKLLSTDLTPGNSGVWTSTKGSLIWKLEIRATQAKSMSLTFKGLSMPEGAELYLITGEKELVHGPITSKNFPQGEQEVATEVLETSRLIVFYSEPENSHEERNIRITGIGYGYRGGGEVEKSLSCNVDVTANQGDCFRIEQRAVAKLLTNNSTALCTGTLLNNTNSDNNLRSFVLTANHCTVTSTGANINFNTLGVRFRDWSGNQSGWVTFVGVQQRVATGTISDCSLLELNQNPTASHSLFYLGWSRSTAPPASSTVLHHPAGDVMKISHDDQASITNPTALAFGTFQLPASSAWRFNPGQAGDFGVLEGGSSGSAMLNTDHRVVGQLKGGDTHTCSNTNGNKWFGRFDVSWGTGATAATRLSDWLDPINTNAPQENAAFRLSGNGTIPCPGLEQDMRAPFLETNGGQDYIYTWRTSSNLTIIGNGANVRYKDTGNCAGCSGWIECDMSTPADCGTQLIATSVRRNITWVNPTPATNFLHTISPATQNNGNVVGSFNNVCVNGDYQIAAGFQGIPIPSNTIFQWTVNGNSSNIITPVYTGNGWGFGFHTNTVGIFSLTVTVVTGTGCLAGKTATYTFQVLSPCSSGSSQMLFNNDGNGEPASSVQIFPNPANDFTVIQLPDEWELEERQIKIVDFFWKGGQKNKY
jgi:hypothetical protein